MVVVVVGATVVVVVVGGGGWVVVVVGATVVVVVGAGAFVVVVVGAGVVVVVGGAVVVVGGTVVVEPGTVVVVTDVVAVTAVVVVEACPLSSRVVVVAGGEPAGDGSPPSSKGPMTVSPDGATVATVSDGVDGLSAAWDVAAAGELNWLPIARAAPLSVSRATTMTSVVVARVLNSILPPGYQTGNRHFVHFS